MQSFKPKHTAEEYLSSLEKKVDELKRRSELPRYSNPASEQDKVVAHFIGRSIQLAVACSRVGDLPTPLGALSRVLCDDLIRLAWVTRSANNAADYAKTVLSEHAKLIRVNLAKKHGKIIDRNTGKDATAAFIPQLAAFINKGKNIEQIAAECGLGKLYDIPFRFASLETHGNTFLGDASPYDSESATLAALPAVISFVRVATLIADNYPNTVTSAEDILRVLRLDKIAA